MEIVLDLEFYWLSVFTILLSMAGVWGFKRVRTLFGRH